MIFLSELEKAFGLKKDIPEMNIDKQFFITSRLVDECFEECRTENFYCGEHNGHTFSAVNAVLEHTYEERAGQDGWMTHTDTVFEGVVLRCKTDAPKNVSLAVNRKEEKQPGPDIADPAAFSLRFDVRAENEYDIPSYVTQSFREMMKNIETATGGELYGVTLGGDQPKGKQASLYYSSGCDYTRTTGIWQTVWLEFVPDGYIKTAKYYHDIEDGAFDIDLTVTRGGRLTAEAFYNGRAVGNTHKNISGGYGRLHLPLDEKHLWEAGNGRLYDLKFTYETENGTDVLFSYAGLRDVRIDGFKVLINGKSVFQRTVLDQGFYPDGIYTAPSDAALKRDIELSMQLGFNGARLHEKMFEPRFLYHCDNAGYLVWGEHANWGLDINRGSSLLNFLPEWCETVERDFNHPAIIGWCPFNETGGTGESECVPDG